MNAMGIYAIRWHYSANPFRDPLHACDDAVRIHPGRTCEAVREAAGQWLEAQRASYPDPNDFAREQEINWHVAKGSRVFPAYTSNFHERSLAMLRHRVVYRSWDFGWHAPACLFAQIDAQGRLLVLREVVGSKQTTREFATDVVKRTAEWFSLHTPGFEDFCDPTGQQQKSIESERNERRDVEVLEGLGIHPKYEWGWNTKDQRALIHQLLQLRTDGTPSLYVDAGACPILSSSFLGRYVYEESKTTGKLKEEPTEEHPWADVMAALRYLVTGLHARLALTRFKASSLAKPPAAARPSGYGMARR